VERAKNDVSENERSKTVVNGEFCMIGAEIVVTFVACAEAHKSG